ncbi:MAG: hypothetical protein ACI4JC_00060 [Faecalibacterium sp.]
MKQHLLPRRLIAAVCAAALAAMCVLPVRAADAPLAKEENIYVNLDASGTVKAAYAVSCFEAEAGQTITDHGYYTAVRAMTTTDPVLYENGVVTITPAESGKIYYEGTMADVTLPWKISIRYFLDGKEIPPEELGGASGALEIRISVCKNEDCAGDFFEKYALQSSVTLDTALAQNIEAPGATIANVGSDKQLTYILLPGQNSELSIRADVTNFAMPAISINGVRLNLNLEVDGESLTGLMEQLQNGAVQLDDGTAALDAGIRQVQAGLDTLNGQSSALTAGSAQVRSALNQMQAALNGISASADELDALLDASGQIKDGIARLDEGAAQLEQQVSFEAYKSILLENGLDLDLVQNGNAQAIQQLEELKKFLPCCLKESVENIILLLRGSSANIDATQLYLDTVNSGLKALHAGTAELNEKYALFDAGVNQLAHVLTDMLQNLAVLADAVNTLASEYGALDDGVNAYTNGVAQLVSGTKQLAGGSAQLLAGTGELRASTQSLDLGEQLNGLLDSLSGEAGAESFLSAQNTAVTSVQFVMQTAAIQRPAAPPAPEPEPVRLTFWQKLLRLFGLY